MAPGWLFILFGIAQFAIMGRNYSLLKRISRYIMAVFFIYAGVNHFINPEFYLPLIPPYIPLPELANLISGILEVGLGAGLLFNGLRKTAAVGIIVLMVLFLPVHLYFIQLGSCIQDILCVPEWMGWARLLIVQPLLILWAWWHIHPD